MKLYHAPNSRSVRIVWLLEELGLDYDLEVMKLGDKAFKSPEYRAKHPMSRVPLLEDGDVSIFESGAIVEYLVTKHGGGKMRPAPESEHFPAYLQWLHYAEGMLMPPVNTIMVETFFLPPERRNEENVKRATKMLGHMLGAVEKHMEGREFIAGDFSGADIMCGHACIVSGRLGGGLDGTPNVKAYTERLQARSAWKKAQEAGA
ncbi:glutathione S-transferase family protein [Minwuia sp.]|uniref:glutathione S-transferase family protein n=1 Tax=Minwuia sp. TaxID=2493630 RepID=UPI003A8CC700